jgi:hypothetical protein
MIEQNKSTQGIDNVQNYRTDRIGEVTNDLISKIKEIKNTHSETGKAYNEMRQSTDSVPAQELL